MGSSPHEGIALKTRQSDFEALFWSESECSEYFIDDTVGPQMVTALPVDAMALVPKRPEDNDCKPRRSHLG